MANYCSNCGKKLEENAAICIECGNIILDNSNKTTTTTTSTENQKSKIVAGLLGIFLGVFGVHNFYLGYTGKGLVQLLMTILSCGILSFASAIWAFIESILILAGNITTDAKGIPLKD